VDMKKADKIKKNMKVINKLNDVFESVFFYSSFFLFFVDFNRRYPQPT
jgi:ribonucleotide reductase beta subunit family protein with ferritin-like domain